MSGARDGMNKVIDKELWLAGLPFSGGIGAIDDGVNETQRTYQQFGGVPPLEDTVAEDGSLGVRTLTYIETHRIQRLAKGYNPTSAVSPLIVRHEDANSFPAWSNTMNAKHTEYVESTYYGTWETGLIPREQGGQTDIEQGQFSGKCAAPLSFPDTVIYGERAAVTVSGANYIATLSNTPFKPLDYDQYALDIYLLSGTGPGMSHYLEGGAAYVSVAGAVSIPTADVDLPDGWAAPQYAFTVLMADASTNGGCHLKKTLVTGGLSKYDNFWGSN